MPEDGKPSLADHLNRRVVLDTQGSFLFIGNLVAWDGRGYWLDDADVHDCSEGHASKEEYVNIARELDRQGSRHINRRRVFVERRSIICVSALEDVVTTDDSEEQGEWVP